MLCQLLSPRVLKKVHHHLSSFLGHYITTKHQAPLREASQPFYLALCTWAMPRWMWGSSRTHPSVPAMDHINLSKVWQMTWRVGGEGWTGNYGRSKPLSKGSQEKDAPVCLNLGYFQKQFNLPYPVQVRITLSVFFLHWSRNIGSSERVKICCSLTLTCLLNASIHS